MRLYPLGRSLPSLDGRAPAPWGPVRMWTSALPVTSLRRCRRSST